MRTLRVLALGAAALLLASCGQTAGDVIEAYKPRVEAIRTALKAAVANLPPLGATETAPGAGLDPKPAYDAKAKNFNVAFLTVEELDGTATPDFNLILDSDLGRALAWTGPSNPMAESVMNDSAGNLGEQFEGAIKTPYAVIYRPVSYAKPVAVDEKTFDGGTLDLEAFLIRLDGAKPVATCRIEANAATEVSYSYKQGDDPKEKLENFASSTLWTDARAKLSKCLSEQTGGTFDFERS